MRLRSAASIISAASIAALATGASADVVTLQVELDGHASGTYQLTGQSAMFASMTGAGTSGGQLDDVVSGSTSIGYTEVFPPPTLADYLTFGYFGRILTLDGAGGTLDTSMIVALQPGVGVGQTIDGLLRVDDEATLVAALAGFDTPEFFNLLSAASGSAISNGAIGVPPIGRPGETLDLIAFIGGAHGDEGVKVGEFSFSVVPTPASVLALGALAALRRRRT